MRYLSFSRASHRAGVKRIRQACFEDRSMLPVHAACVVANAARDALAALLASEVRLRLFEPAIPSAHAWQAIARDAYAYGVRGASGDAAIVVRAKDAASLVAAAFGEASGTGRELSGLERTVLDRAVRAIATACAPVVGMPESVTRIPELRGFVTFFELAIERPVEARVGIALARDPEPARSGELPAEALAGVELELAVRVEGEALCARELNLEPGCVVRLGRWPALSGKLLLAGSTLAHGECGVQGNRFALMITGPLIVEGSGK
jgi:hypothetical protein